MIRRYAGLADYYMAETRPKMALPNWRLALVYDVVTLFVALAPSAIVVLIEMLVLKKSVLTWYIQLINIAVGSVVVIFSLKRAGSYITKRYIIGNKEGLLRWAIGYAVTGGCLQILYSLRTNSLNSMSVMLTALSALLGIAITIYFVPKFVSESSEKELEINEPVCEAQPPITIARGIWMVIRRIIWALVLLLVAPPTIFVILSFASIPNRTAMIIVYIWEFLAIAYLVKVYLIDVGSKRGIQRNLLKEKLDEIWKSFWRDNTD